MPARNIDRSPDPVLVGDAGRNGEGPGSELKKFFGRFGIHPSRECRCNYYAALMDQEGPDWCEQHLEKIVGWIGDEARRRGLPFNATLGRVLVRRAIERSRKGQR